MTKDEINEIIATKIWGWKKSRLYSPDRTEHRWGWFNDTDDFVFTDYTPAINWVQAFEALEKFCKDKKTTYSIIYCGEGNDYICMIFSSSHPIPSSKNADICQAICNALIEALEIK